MGELQKHAEMHSEFGADRITGVIEPVVVVCSKTTNQVVASGTWPRVDYNVVEVDTHGAVRTGTLWEFTVPLSGVYHITAGVWFDATNTWADGHVALMWLGVINVGDFIIERQTMFSTTASRLVFLHGSITLYLAKEQRIYIGVYQNTGVAQTILGNQKATRLSIVRVM